MIILVLNQNHSVISVLSPRIEGLHRHSILRWCEKQPPLSHTHQTWQEVRDYLSFRIVNYRRSALGDRFELGNTDGDAVPFLLGIFELNVSLVANYMLKLLHGLFSQFFLESVFLFLKERVVVS